ncbi:MAG: hypothetical protein J7J52_01380 [Deltaproteobacteria bacterium]|nr:hypothetical protein [Deltaproteobacteria bacterium]
MNFAKVLVFMVGYYLFLGILLGGMTDAYQQLNTTNETIPTDDYERGIFEYNSIAEMYENLSGQFEEISQNQWPGDNREMGLNSRITIGPVYVRTEDYPEYPKGREIFEPDSWQSFANQWFPHSDGHGGIAWGGNWKMEYAYWKYGINDSLDPGDPVWIYPHIYYNSPGVYIGGEFFKSSILVVWGFDASRGKIFQEAIGSNVQPAYQQNITTPYGYTAIYKFYAGTMGNKDLQYVIDVVTLDKPGLIDNFITALKGGMNYQQIENMWDVKVKLAERYCGVVYGVDGRSEQLQWIPQGAVPYHANTGGGLKGIWETLKSAVTGYAILTSDQVPMPIQAIIYALTLGPFSLLLVYIAIKEVLWAAPFVGGGG